jgi:hypothetical protein
MNISGMVYEMQPLIDIPCGDPNDSNQAGYLQHRNKIRAMASNY